MAALKFPENLFLKRQLVHSDMTLLATKSGLCRGTVYEIMNGRRRMSDSLKKAIIELLTTRNELNEILNDIL